MFSKAAKFAKRSICRRVHASERDGKHGRFTCPLCGVKWFVISFRFTKESEVIVHSEPDKFEKVETSK